MGGEQGEADEKDRARRRLGWAGTWLQFTGEVGLALAAGALLPLGLEALRTPSPLVVVVIPYLAACIAAILTGHGLRKDPGRSRVPALAASGSLAVGAWYALKEWNELAPGGGPLTTASEGLTFGTYVLAGVLAAAAAATLTILVTRAQRAPLWATGAAWAGTGIVALAAAQAVVLAAPQVELEESVERAARSSGGCDLLEESRSLETGAGSVAYPETENLGTEHLPRLDRSGEAEAGGLIERDPETAKNVTVHHAEGRDVRGALALVDAGLRAAGLEVTRRGSAVREGALADVHVEYEGGGRSGRVQVEPCGDGALILDAEEVQTSRTGACTDPSLHSRCDTLYATLQGAFTLQPAEVKDGRLSVRHQTTALAPSSFHAEEVKENLQAAGWELTESSCGGDCFDAGSEVTLRLERGGTVLQVELQDTPSGDAEVTYHATEKQP